MHLLPRSSSSGLRFGLDRPPISEYPRERKLVVGLGNGGCTIIKQADLWRGSSSCREEAMTQGGEALWLDNWYKPAWVELKQAFCDARSDTSKRRPPGCGSCKTYGGELQVATCRKLCEDGQVIEAVDALNLLVHQGCHIPENLFYWVLKSCKNLVLGRRVHALTVTSGYESNGFLANHLICMYASHGRLEEAMEVFSKVATPSAYMWASIIFAYARHGEFKQAIRRYREMRESTVEPDNRVYVAVLKACASAGDLATGKDVHAHILASAGKPDMFVQNSLVDMYAKCGSLRDAQRVFDSLLHKDVVTWTTLIAGYVQQGMGREALILYRTMKQEDITPPDAVTFVCLLQACALVGVAGLHEGQHFHAYVQERGLQYDLVVGSSLVHMYSKCGSLRDARRVFDRLPQKNSVTWTVMIAGYVDQGMGQEALGLYSSMQPEDITLLDSVTFVCLLQACACVGVAAMHRGKKLHEHIVERGLEADEVVGASLVDMYAKCGSFENAQSVFHKLSQKTVVTWTVMIAGYVQQGLYEEALGVYNSMQQEGITSPNSFTFACLLRACASIAALPLGKQLHAQLEQSGFQADSFVGSSLVYMYAKCGSLVDAQLVFDSLPEREITAWGALIAGYACQGESELVFDLVDRMRLEGIQPDSIIFLSLLTVCSHVGLVEKGRKVFEAMRIDYGITPSIEHYTCMMDLLGRAGYLDEALHMGKTMPFQPDGAVWLTLLGGCRKWRNVEVGQQAFEFAVRLDEKDAAPYVLMANTYLGAEMLEEAKELQARRVKCRAWKEPGRSWATDMDGVVHAFVAGEQAALETTVREELEERKHKYLRKFPSHF